MLLGGLWKDVSLFKEERPFHFREVWVQTLGLKDDGTADLRLYYDFAAGRKSLDGFTLKFTGVCVDSNFVLNSAAYFTNGYIQFELPAAKLWYPRGYGKPELYHLHAYLYDSKMNCVAEYEKDFGIRTIELERTDMNLEGTGKFQFRINGRNVRARGCNHVPFDALHSRDKSRTQQVLALYDDLQCNMIRCWGGGIYESEEFYDFCDQHGIMVWQDFMMACAIYPRHPDFFEIMREEVEWVIRKYRSRTSLILWCGDNECDQYFAVHNIPFDCNTVTRKLLPEVLRRLDPSRPYLPCSPCLSEEALKYGLQSIDIVPERHIWGARDGFKLPYYSKHKAKFISETGWFGCPNRSALERFLTPGHCELNELDPEWDYHSSNPFGKTSYMAQRSQLIGKQIGEYFNRAPVDLDEYIKASQIFQAEALKFTIETARLDPECSGILWWNMIDCWPLFSDSVVDYYFGKKLSYHYIKRVLSPFCIMCTEPEAWNSQVVAVNDSSEYAQGTFTVECEGQILLQGDFKLSPGSCMKLGELPSLRNSNALWLIRWNNQGVTGVNHYISGNNIVDYHWYCNALPKIAALDNSFESEKVGC
jgi:beta-mannosidase